MLWLLIAIAAFNLVVSLVMIVRDKRDDVAILMTLGANANTVQAIFLWQGAAIALLGIAAGVGLGLLGAVWVGVFGWGCSDGGVWMGVLGWGCQCGAD